LLDNQTDTIKTEYINIIKKINDVVPIPKITDVYFPSKSGDLKSCSGAGFGVFVIGNQYAGIVYLNLTDNLFKNSKNSPEQLIGKDAYEVALQFASEDELDKTIGLGVINAICQMVFQLSNFALDTASDSLGTLNLESSDKAGMVGFFPPLVKQIENIGIPLTIIEKKEFLVKSAKNWKVTLDPKELEHCNKILCTSTTILNNSVDDILSYCKGADKISIVGPSAGYLPDPLFKRGVDVVGGTVVVEPEFFIKLVQSGQRWGPATSKYCITKENYPGIDALLEKIKNKKK
jgi:uncharacterized protein